MTNKVRVHELAKEFNLTSNELIHLLKQEGVDVSSHMAAVDEDIAVLIRDQLAEDKAKRKEKGQKPEKASRKQSAERPSASMPKKAETKSENAVESLDSEKTSRLTTTTVAAGEYLHSGQKPAGSKEIHIKPPFIVKDLAKALDIKPNELIFDLLKKNIFATINQALDPGVAEEICKTRGFELIADKREKQAGSHVARDEEIAPEDVVYKDEHVHFRPPVVTFLGHVDHGKTSLLDRIRHSNETAKESGGITQHIGATTINWKKHQITFIDTPGHEAFTAMRSRGAGTTDIAVLVVAADDGVMPQTTEALDHAKAATVPIIVALNKIDLPTSDPMKVMTQLQQNGMMVEEWGGDVGMVKVSASTGEGIDQLLERILLEAEMLELKCNPKLPVKAVVLESQLEQGHGPTVNILIKNGTVRLGDIVICGQYYGKVKALIGSGGVRLKKAGPSVAVKVVGLSGVPESGSMLAGCKDEKQAKRLTEARESKTREFQLQPRRQANLDDLFRQIEEESRRDLNVVLKTDVQGTGEAVVEMLNKLESPKIKIKVIHFGVGAITDNDVLLASASDAVIVGFHVRVNPGVSTLAKREGVDIRLYSVIYELVEQMKDAMIGMLEPEMREEKLGQAEILQIFSMSKGGKVCGCSVTKGIVRQGAKARVFRGEDLIYNGSIQSLRRFQEDVKEVRQGFECGIRLDHFDDFEPGDIVDVYDYKEFKATL